MTNSRVSKKKRTNSTVDDEVEILKMISKDIRDPTGISWNVVTVM